MLSGQEFNLQSAGDDTQGVVFDNRPTAVSWRDWFDKRLETKADGIGLRPSLSSQVFSMSIGGVCALEKKYVSGPISKEILDT